MNRFVLTQPIEIQGHDVFGRQAALRLEPVAKQGWYWRVGGEDIPLSPALLHLAHHRLVLRHKQRELHVFEHLGALRFTGLDGIRIRSKTAYLPYDGRAHALWNALKYVRRRSDDFAVKRNDIRTATYKTKNALTRSVSACLGTTEGHMMTIIVAYKKYGEHEVSFPLNAIPTEVFSARPLGNPWWIEPIAYGASLMGVFPYDGVLWPRSSRRGRIGKEIVLHRALDFMGALSVIPGPGESCDGIYRSVCGNHAADVVLVKKFAA